MVEKLLRQFGRELTLVGQAGETGVRGLLQPVTGSHQRLAQAHRGVLGRENPVEYLYIGPAEPEPRASDTVRAGDREFEVRTAEPIYGAGAPVYCWALCVEKGGQDTWEMNV